MSFPLSFCPDGEFVLQRLRRFYVDRAQDMVLATMSLEHSAALKEMAAKYPAGYCEYPDPEDRVQFWHARLAEKIPVRDDSIPSAYLSEMDQGVYGGVIGGRGQFLADPEWGWISSMIKPILADWSEFDRLAPFDPQDLNNEWLRRYLRQLDHFVAAARGKWGLSHFILIDGFNFAYELVGATNTYYGVMDQPETVKRAIHYAFDVNVKIQSLFFERAPLVAGGTCSNMAQWLPGRVVSESIDPFHMTSVDYFEEWGREPAERIMTHFDGGIVHLHANGRHLLPAAATLKGLKAIILQDDRDRPPSFTVAGEVKKQVGDMPVVVYSIEFKDFYPLLQEHRLVGGVFYFVKNVPDVDTANRCMAAVREYKV